MPAMETATENLSFDREGFATVAEVAEYLSLSPTTIYEMINKEPPDFPAGRFGKTGIRIPRKAVVEFATRKISEGPKAG